MMRALGLDRRDLRFWALTFGPLLALVAALYAGAFLLAPAHYRFSGFLADTADSYAHRSWARSFADQGLLAEAPTSLSSGSGSDFNLVWYTLGRAMKHTGLTFTALYYGLGIVAGGAMYLLLLAIMKTLIRDRLLARAAYLMAGFGAGVGWLVFLVSRDMLEGDLLTADIAHGDGFPVYAFWTSPLLCFSWCLLLGAALLLIRGSERAGPGTALGLAALALAAGFSHPYQLLILPPVFGVWYLLLGIRRGRLFHPRWVNLIAYAAGAAPALWHHHPVLRAPGLSVLTEAAVRTHPPLNLVLGYGPFLLLAVLGCRGLYPLRLFSDRYVLVSVWALAGGVLPYAWPFFRDEGKLTQGWIVPLSVLGAWGLGAAVLPKVLGAAAPAAGPDIYAAEERTAAASGPPRAAMRTAALATVGALLFLPSTGILMARQMKGLFTRGEVWFDFADDPKRVIHEDEVEALRWIDREIKGRPLVLSSRATGLALPGFASVRAYWGHAGSMAPDEERGRPLMAYFSRSSTAAQRRDFLRQYPVDWLYWGPDEQAYYGDPPPDADLLEPVYQKGTVRIFRVHRERLPG